MSKGFVAILMGSDSDLPLVENTIKVLKDFNIKVEVKVTSAHRTPGVTAQFVKDADKQDFMKSFNYANICKAVPMIPLKHAIKKYKIQNTIKIYSIPFSKVYRFVGDYCDENYYVNGNVKEIQMEFLKKMSR